MYDLNDAEPQRGPIGDLIPDGTFAKVKLTIRPGGTNGSVPMDAGLLKQSASSDAKMLDCEFTVTEGPFARRKFWQFFTVSGGTLDSKGQSKGWNITKSTLRAMIDSATGLDPKDMSEAAKQKRVIQGLKQFDGITFVARIMVDPATDPQYSDKNVLANVVVPGEPQYAPVMRGEAVAPDPVNAKPRKGKVASGASGGPAWENQGGGGAAPAWQGNGQTPPPTSAPTNGPAWLNA